MSLTPMSELLFARRNFYGAGGMASLALKYSQRFN